MEARTAINAALDELEQTAGHLNLNGARKAQIGSGQRGDDRRRTFRFQDDAVIDSRSGRTARARDVMKGRFDLLWT